jgi:hypothetical protein
MLCYIYVQIFPQLNFLYINDDKVLESIPLLDLLHRKLEYCSIDKIDTIH